MEVEVENDRIVSLRGDLQHPLSRGFLCSKGAACLDMTTDPLRILHPYKREGSDWRRISWDEAYGEISRRLGEIISKYGPNSIGMYFGAGTATSSVKPVVAGAFLEELGSDRMYNVLTLEFTNRYLVMEEMYGHQSMVTQPDLEETQCLLVFGSNPLVSLDHPGIVSSLKAFKKRGAKLIVVDPRKTETAEIADLHADVIPGTDLFMLLAMHSHIFENNLHDPQFLREHCVNHEDLQGLEKPTPEAAEKICGVPADKIRQIAEEFAKAESACAVAKLGIHTSRNCTVTYWLIDHGQRRQAGRPHLQSRRDRPHQGHGSPRATKGSRVEDREVPPHHGRIPCISAAERDDDGWPGSNPRPHRGGRRSLAVLSQCQGIRSSR
jgi:anaerobic selenocysteine-containing dehydrogenase